MGLVRIKMDAEPTTAYLMTYREGKCDANCSFCPQARGSRSRADLLSRVTWPTFPLRSVVFGIERGFLRGSIRRACVEALNYPGVLQDVIAIVEAIRSRVKVPISISCQPLDRKGLEELVKVGVDRVSIPLDAVTKDLFEKVKGSLAGGPYSWEAHLFALREAVKAFGRGRVTTHLIVGLGETERDVLKAIQWCTDLGVNPGLFAFTPIPGTALEAHPQPPLESYRRVQVARYLIINEMIRFEDVGFDSHGRVISFNVSREGLIGVIRTGNPFLTSGCPSCNRPYYNERPGGPLYNYPRPLTKEEVEEAEVQVLRSLDQRPY